jgi:hypothetical protein
MKLVAVLENGGCTKNLALFRVPDLRPTQGNGVREATLRCCLGRMQHLVAANTTAIGGGGEGVPDDYSNEEAEYAHRNKGDCPT